MWWLCYAVGGHFDGLLWGKQSLLISTKCSRHSLTEVVSFRMTTPPIRHKGTVSTNCLTGLIMMWITDWDPDEYLHVQEHQDTKWERLIFQSSSFRDFEKSLYLRSVWPAKAFFLVWVGSFSVWFLNQCARTNMKYCTCYFGAMKFPLTCRTC